MHYIGVGYHEWYSYTVAKNENGGIKAGGSVNSTTEENRQFLQPYHSGTAVIEETRNWGLIYDWLERILANVALPNPRKVKAIAEARIKTDKTSADILAALLRTRLLAMAHAPGRQTRDARNILRQRMLFAQVQTMVKNRICDVLDRHADVLSQTPRALHLFGTP